MPTSCAAYGCTAVYNKNTSTSFHRFPRNPRRRMEWIQLVRRENFHPTRHTFLCSKHFEQTCFDRTGQTRRLRENAVPTIFDFPPHVEKKLAGRKSLLSSMGISNPRTPSFDSTDDNTSISASTSNSTCSQTSSGIKGVFEEHSYCLANPAEAKRKIFQLLDEVDYLRQQVKISRQRERRVVEKWKGISNLLVELREKNILPNDEEPEHI